MRARQQRGDANLLDGIIIRTSAPLNRRQAQIAGRAARHDSWGRGGSAHYW